MWPSSFNSHSIQSLIQTSNYKKTVTQPAPSMVNENSVVRDNTRNIVRHSLDNKECPKNLQLDQLGDCTVRPTIRENTKMFHLDIDGISSLG